MSTVPNTGRNQSDSGYRGLDEEVQCQPPGGSRLAPDIEVGTDYLFYFLQPDRAGKKYVTIHCWVYIVLAGLTGFTRDSCSIIMYICAFHFYIIYIHFLSAYHGIPQTFDEILTA